jgi:hypothetical protein
MAHGLVTRDDNTITVNPRFQKLEEFIREFRRFNNSRMATMAAKAAVIMWSRGSQFIIRVPRGTTISDPRFRPTATTLMARYGIPLISNIEYYYFSPSAKPIGPEEVVLHSLLTDGITNVTLGLILIAKAELDRNKLLMIAKEYDLRPQIEGMLRFLDSGKSDPGVILPTWEEFEDKASEYGLRLERPS